MRLGWGLLAGMLLAGSMTVFARAQVSGAPGTPDPFSTGVPGFGSGMGRRSGQMTRQQLKAMNTERQKKLVSDTDRLLALALELKAAAHQVTVPTPELAKKLEEMERLAHEVRTKEIQ